MLFNITHFRGENSLAFKFSARILQPLKSHGIIVVQFYFLLSERVIYMRISVLKLHRQGRFDKIDIPYRNR